MRELRPVEDKIAVANGNSNILSWSGDEGNSKRVPKDSSGEIAKELEKYGVDGIEYRDGDVDFSPVSKFQVDFDDTDQLYVDVANSITMGDLQKKDGSSKNRSEFNSVVREKWQKLAKQQLVERIQSEPGFAADLQKRTGIDAGSVKSVAGTVASSVADTVVGGAKEMAMGVKNAFTPSYWRLHDEEGE